MEVGEETVVVEVDLEAGSFLGLQGDFLVLFAAEVGQDFVP